MHRYREESTSQAQTDPWDWLSSWVGEDCCKWSGVGCNNITGSVNRLDLHNRYSDGLDYSGAKVSAFGFGGEINPSLLVLKDLVYLDLSMNNFECVQLPSFIGSLEKLKYLNLSRTSFVGVIPPNLGNLSRLLYLDLSNFLDNNPKMLDLSGNRLTGKLPDSLGYLKSLRYLNLSTNSFQGSIPKSIGNLTSLEEFDLRWNLMSGIIPESLWELSSLVSLRLSENTWEGAITEAHFAKLGGLREVSIANNSPNISLVFNISYDWIPPFQLRYFIITSCQLGPKFPTWLRYQTELTTVILRNARISDTIPDWFWQLDLQLDYLNVAFNQLSGRMPNSLRFRVDIIVDLTSNRFEGPLPLWSSNIIELFLRDNLFSGPIPHNISQVMPNLTHLDISGNSLSGSIPLSLGNLSHFEFMIISNNNLSGEIPHFWNNIPSLYFVDMSNNSLSGTIPRSLGSLTSLNFLILSSNNFSGEVPSLKNCTDMRILDLGDNKFSGPIPASIGESMLSLLILSVRSNSFTGSIPLQLCGLSTLHILDLSYNNLSENVPHWKHRQRYRNLWSMEKIGGGVERMSASNIGNLRSIETLDLSMNKLSGSIPQNMVSLTFLNHLNLSNNNLSGKIPTGNQFKTFVDPSIYEGNDGLSGCPLPTGCHDNEEAPQVPSGDGGEDDDSKLEKL
ncbi:hypothetical protein PRUPE_7G032500 [Prunus persica]|uniref:Disease resistance R13L4/SHOC-2-like LRR domain-containing protein n=1 Tax=Prunus persica TaxID=3760 RepID=A0A251N8B5_PRUPE|nr:hypothetical protein PRUPE_7G032500 [Prunus persica]